MMGVTIFSTDAFGYYAPMGRVASNTRTLPDVTD